MDLRECARLETKYGDPVMLEGVKATGELRGLMLEMSVEQRFRNPTDKNVEVVYTFPLPWGAVLLGVDVQLGDQHLTGAVIEKKQAEAQYEEALSEGNAAIMLEKNRDLSYSLNLGNLAAQENCVITLRYAQTLQFEQRGLRLLIPTVIAPRYGNAMIDGGLQPHQAPIHNLLAEYPFDIELRLHADLARARVASPSHPIGVAHNSTEEGNVLTVSLARRGALDRDFVLVIDQLAHDSMAVLARDCVEPDGVVALASFCPRVPAQGATTIGVKILVDCSGSMGGDSIEAAKRSLQAIVRQLGKGDRFSLSRFGDTVEHRSRGLWKATETTQLAAQRWVGGLQADLGGTEMEAALSSTFALAQTVASDVLIVTDGEISAIDGTIESAKASGHRLFVVGIGSSPAESHLRRLAEATGGACDFVAPGEAVEPAVLRMFSRLRSPRLTDLTVVWPADVNPEWVSSLHTSVFDGDTINVFALLQQVPAGEIRLLGVRSLGGDPEEIACAQFGAVVEPGDTLSRLAASLRLQSLKSDAQAGEARQLTVAYQLVTDQTNFFLVHQRAEEDKPTDMPDLHKVGQMLAAGWGGTGSVLFSRESALFVDYNCLEQPVVMRCRSPGIKFSRSSAGDVDIPAFLRRRDQSIDHANPRHWSESEGYKGLTPLGLSEWLSITPMAEWPKTYTELRQIGLGAWVVDWLELTVAISAVRSLPEQTVVEAFLYVMSQRDTQETLKKSLGLLQSFKAIAQRLKGMFAGIPSASQPSVDANLVEEVMDALDGMTADTWPVQVYAMETMAKRVSDESQRAALSTRI